MNNELRSKFRISLKRDGKIVSTNNDLLKRNESERETPFEDIYQAEFTKITSCADITIIHDYPKKEIYFTPKNSLTLLAKTILEDEKILRREYVETIGNYVFFHKEEFSKKQVVRKRLLLIYPKNGTKDNPTHFCYESYNKFGVIDFCATNIKDPSISNCQENYIRYIYDNGNVVSKEIYSGSEFYYRHLTNAPPSLYCRQGNLIERYIYSSKTLYHEINFKRTDTSKYPVMIISDKNDITKFVNLSSANTSVVDSAVHGTIFEDLKCRIHYQKKFFEESVQNEIHDSSNQPEPLQIIPKDVPNDFLTYDCAALQAKAFYKIAQPEKLSNLNWCRTLPNSMDLWGYIPLPQTYVNGLIVTEFATEFRNDVKRNAYELQCLMDGSACLFNNQLYRLGKYDCQEGYKTGTDAIYELLKQNNVEEKYKNIFIDKVPLIPNKWRTKSQENATNINLVYEKLLSDIHCRENLQEMGSPRFMLSQYDNRIQKRLIELSNNSLYKDAMRYQKNTLKKF